MRLRGRGRPKLGKLRRDGDVEGLRRAASFKDVLVARDGRLIDKGVPVRVAALEALSKPEGEEILPALIAALRDEAPEVRRAAVVALGKDGSSEAIGALVDFLATEVAAEDPEVRRTALERVRASEWPGFSERWARKVRDSRNGSLTEADRETFTALLTSDSTAEPEQRVFDVLAPRVGDDSPEGSGHACETVLSWCMPNRFHGMPALLEAERVPEPLIRLAGRSGDQALLDPLTTLLRRSDSGLRREAAEALGALCDTRAVLPLLKATSDPELEVRRAAVAAFDSLGGAGVTAAMSLLVQEANRGLAPPESETQEIDAKQDDGGAGSSESAEAQETTEPPEASVEPGPSVVSQPPVAARPPPSAPAPVPQDWSTRLLNWWSRRSK